MMLLFTRAPEVVHVLLKVLALAAIATFLHSESGSITEEWKASSAQARTMMVALLLVTTYVLLYSQVVPW